MQGVVSGWVQKSRTEETLLVALEDVLADIYSHLPMKRRQEFVKRWDATIGAYFSELTFVPAQRPLKALAGAPTSVDHVWRMLLNAAPAQRASPQPARSCTPVGTERRSQDGTVTNESPRSVSAASASSGDMLDLLIGDTVNRAFESPPLQARTPAPDDHGPTVTPTAYSATPVRSPT